MARRDDFEDETGFIKNIFKRKNMEPMPPSMARLLLIVAALAVVGVVVAVAVATWPKNSGGMDENSIPVVQADNSPTHIKPDEPGGMQVPNKDSTIFDAISKYDEPEKKVDNLLEDSEVPMKKEQVFATETSGVVADVEPEVTKLETPKDIVKPEPNVQKTPEKKVEKSDIISTLKSEVGTAKTATGSRYIQLASVKSQADANAKWTKMQGQFSSLKPLTSRVQKADLGAKGIFYRLQAGPLLADEAKTICATVKAGKGDCLLVK